MSRLLQGKTNLLDLVHIHVIVAITGETMSCLYLLIFSSQVLQFTSSIISFFGLTYCFTLHLDVCLYCTGVNGTRVYFPVVYVFHAYSIYDNKHGPQPQYEAQRSSHLWPHLFMFNLSTLLTMQFNNLVRHLCVVLVATNVAQSLYSQAHMRSRMSRGLIIVTINHNVEIYVKATRA